VTFDWEPSMPAGAAAIRLGGRGTDWRLDSDERVGAVQRKAARRARREPVADGEVERD
jgi:GTP-binding protein